jgi:hypothetical protein
MGVVRIAEKQNKQVKRNRITEIYPNPHPIILSPIRGGAIIGGTYDIGFKRGFMGYIGLLLNDPYKRDRIDG